MKREDVIEKMAKAMQNDFPLINYGVREGERTTWPIEITVFERAAEAALDSFLDGLHEMTYVDNPAPSGCVDMVSEQAFLHADFYQQILNMRK